MHPVSPSLAQRWATLLHTSPSFRIRDAAATLSVSEAELLATAADNSVVVRIHSRWKELFEALKALGPVMCLGRNDWAVGETTGPFDRLMFSEMPMAAIVGTHQNLRTFWHRWKVGYAVVKSTESRTLRSFQVFDEYGDSVLKIYVKEADLAEGFDRIVEEFRDDAADAPTFLPVPTQTELAPLPADFDRAAWEKDWLGMHDVHDFYPMLRRYQVDRVTALRHAPDGYTWRVRNDSYRTILEQVRDRNMNMMVFVASRGAVVIYGGPIQNLVEHGEFYNVLDPSFNLHLMPKGIHEAWLVRKPTVDGDITSLEFFSQDGTLILQYFGLRQRDKGEPEHEDWRALVHALPQLAAD